MRDSDHPLTRRDFVRATLLAGGAAGAAALLPRSLRAGVPAPAGLPLYVGTYTDAGRAEGVYGFLLDPRTGALAPRGAWSVGPNPSFLALHPKRPVLYAVNETTERDGRTTGGVAAFTLRADGGLAPLGLARDSGGGAPCYLSVDRAGKWAFVANYAAGSVSVFPLGADGALGDATDVKWHEGKGPNAARQEGPHAHCILPDPSGRFLVAADLGADRLVVYRLNEGTGKLAVISTAATAGGAGPRHLAFSPDGRTLYDVNELDLTLGRWRWDAKTGTLTAAGTVPLLDAAPAVESTGADLHFGPTGRFLYVSVRGANVVTQLDTMGDAPRVVGHVSTGGNWPRNFSFDPTGRFAVVANQRTNDLVVFAVDPASGALVPTGTKVTVPQPVCVRFLGDLKIRKD